MRTRATSYGLWGSLLLSLVLTAACGGRTAPVQTPITLAAGASPAHTEQTLLAVLPRRGWTVDGVQPGRILSFLVVRKHLLRVEIRYDAQQIAIYYIDSNNLAARIESDGHIYAHKAVNAWIRRLALDVATALAAPPVTSGAAAAPGLAPAAPAGGPATGQLPPAAQGAPTAPVQGSPPSGPAQGAPGAQPAR